MSNVIEIDASSWTRRLDFYEAIVTAIGAEPWHGRNFNALVESLAFGEMSKLEPPFTIRLNGLQNVATELHRDIIDLVQDLEDMLATLHEDRPKPGFPSTFVIE